MAKSSPKVGGFKTLNTIRYARWFKFNMIKIYSVLLSTIIKYQSTLQIEIGHHLHLHPLSASNCHTGLNK